MKMNTKLIGLVGMGIACLFVVAGLFCLYMGNQAKKKVVELNQQVEQLDREAQALEEFVILMKENGVIIEKINVAADEFERIEYHIEYKNDDVTWGKVKKIFASIEGYSIELENIILKIEKMVDDGKFKFDPELEAIAVQYTTDIKQDIALTRNFFQELTESQEKNKK